MSPKRSYPFKAVSAPNFANLTFDSPTWGLVRLVMIGASLIAYLALVILLYFASNMEGLGVRYWLVPPLVFAGVMLGSVRFIKYAYALPTMQLATQYLLAVAFGMSYPALVISDGKKQISEKSHNLIDLVGGPGYLIIQPGNVVVLENLKGYPRVLGPGRHLISRLESIKEIASLEEQNAQVEKMSGVTKDGIPVDVKDVRYRYRLLRSEATQHAPVFAPINLYSFSEEGVLNMAYNRSVNANGVTSWHFNVNSQIDTAVGDFIQQHSIDYITAPVSYGHDPRHELYERIQHGSVKGNLRARGAELMWIDIGHFEIPDKQVGEQRSSTWQAKWIGDAHVVRAYGESKLLTYQEMGRAEAQTEMLMSIVHALQDVGAESDSRQHLRKVTLARIASLLDGMREQIRESESES